MRGAEPAFPGEDPGLRRIPAEDRTPIRPTAPSCDVWPVESVLLQALQSQGTIFGCLGAKR